ncbi:Pyridoxamine 5'-phosphate oxidase [Loktanella fryxellensis]|uniref:Pyridoxine/pyridoxamine 5'-phosphate oxidase n=1 Tax=Loktanella fryxellensis TaxID=245187 RepID=A0A1H7YM30_9RHOB|nr:pyridoxamine 5'-phosphate oxidase [Loktanella fryxellensis]SEM46358.1 Pyridoxamine 5'-phosphate oxidase [Loktanella fryxellensis]
MSDRDGIFAGDDPFALARDWMAVARDSEVNDPDAVALATVDPAGMPNVRIVLLRRIEDDAFVFFTNYDSAKGREIGASGTAAFVLHWKSLRRQIRVRGTVTREDGAIADDYYAGRALDSRLGAWASAQSNPLDSRAVLMDKLEAMRQTWGDAPPRPPFWGGFRITPTEIEFWADGPNRLHDRYRWTAAAPSDTHRTATGWTVSRLSP